jgi:hypothetical protein
MVLNIRLSFSYRFDCPKCPLARLQVYAGGAQSVHPAALYSLMASGFQQRGQGVSGRLVLSRKARVQHGQEIKRQETGYRTRPMKRKLLHLEIRRYEYDV